jgi:hypothetical protein
MISRKLFNIASILTDIAPAIEMKPKKMICDPIFFEFDQSRCGHGFSLLLK